MRVYKLAVVVTHPIQYYVPWYRELAARPDIECLVYFCQRQGGKGQAAAGFGVEFEWDTGLLDGYHYRFLKNVSSNPSTDNYKGCDTPEIESLLAQGNFDAVLIHGWYVKSYIQALRACKKLNIPVATHADSNLLAPRSRFTLLVKFILYRWFFKKFSALFYVGTHTRRYFEHYGVPAEKLFFVPHSVDNDYFATAAVKAKASGRGELRAEFGLSKDALVALFVGKLLANKNPTDLLRAAETARRKHLNLEVLIVGDGPLRATLEQIAHTMGGVQISGFMNQSQIARAYAAADVLVLPSSRETWGLVVNEAMACGLPALVSDQVGCAPNLVLANETGNIFPTHDVELLANHLANFAENPQNVVAMGQAAKRLISNYTAKNSAAAIQNALQVICK